MMVNGKEYPLWSQFVGRQKEWIGGTLSELDGLSWFETKIISINLLENGESSAFFEVNGEYFSCGFDVRHGGVTAGEEGWVTFRGYGGHTWRIKQKQKS